MSWSAWLLASSILLSNGEAPAIMVVSDTMAEVPRTAANEAACFAKAEGLDQPVRVALRVWVQQGSRYVPATYFMDLVMCRVGVGL